MQSGIWKHITLAALIAVVLYAVAFWAIEHRRTRNGPWQVTFTASERGEPALHIYQPHLGINGVRLVFAGRGPETNLAASTVVFDRPQPTPFDLPFGRCVFMDLTFLPGVVTCDFFGHEVEFMPRTLVVDKREIAWQSNAVVEISGTGTKGTFNLQRSTPNHQ